MVSFLDTSSSRNEGGDSNDGENSEAGSCSSGAPRPPSKPTPPRLSSTSTAAAQRGLLLYPGSSRTKEKQFVQLSATRKRTTEPEGTPLLDLQPEPPPEARPAKKAPLEKGTNDGGERKKTVEITAGVRKSMSNRQPAGGGGGRAEQSVGSRSSLLSQQASTRRSTKASGKTRWTQREASEGTTNRGSILPASLQKGHEEQGQQVAVNRTPGQEEEEQAKEDETSTAQGDERSGEVRDTSDGLGPYEREAQAADGQEEEESGQEGEGGTPDGKPAGEIDRATGQSDDPDTKGEKHNDQNGTELDGSPSMPVVSFSTPEEPQETAQPTTPAHTDEREGSPSALPDDVEGGEQHPTVGTVAAESSSGENDDKNSSSSNQSSRCRSLGLARPGSAEKLASLYGRIACLHPEEPEEEQDPRPPEADEEDKRDDSYAEREDEERGGRERSQENEGEDSLTKTVNTPDRTDRDRDTCAAYATLSSKPKQSSVDDSEVEPTYRQSRGGDDKEGNTDDPHDVSEWRGVEEVGSSSNARGAVEPTTSCTGHREEARETTTLARSPSASSPAEKEATEDNRASCEALGEPANLEALAKQTGAPSPEGHQPDVLPPCEPSNSRRSFSPEAWHPGLLPLEALECQNRPASAGASSHSSRLSGSGGDRAARLQHIADNLAFYQNMQDPTSGASSGPGMQTPGRVGEDLDEKKGLTSDGNTDVGGAEWDMTGQGVLREQPIPSSGDAERTGLTGANCSTSGAEFEQINCGLRDGGSHMEAPDRSSLTVPKRHFSAGGIRPSLPFPRSVFSERTGRPLSGPLSRPPVSREPPGLFRPAGAFSSEEIITSSASPPFSCLPRGAFSPASSPLSRAFPVPSYPSSPGMEEADNVDDHDTRTRPCDGNPNTVSIPGSPENRSHPSSSNDRQDEPSSPGATLPSKASLAQAELPLLSPNNPRPLAEPLRQGPPPTSPGGIPAPTAVEQRQWLEWQQEQATRQFLLQSGCSIIPSGETGGPGGRLPPDLSLSWRGDPARGGGLRNEGEAGRGNGQEGKSERSTEKREEGRKGIDGDGASEEQTPLGKNRPVSAGSDRDSLTSVLESQGGPRGHLLSSVSSLHSPSSLAQGKEEESRSGEECGTQLPRAPSPGTENAKQEDRGVEKEIPQKDVQDCSEESQANVPFPRPSAEKKGLSPWKEAAQEVDSLSCQEDLVSLHFPDPQESVTEPANEDQREKPASVCLPEPPARQDCPADLPPAEERENDTGT